MGTKRLAEKAPACVGRERRLAPRHSLPVRGSGLLRPQLAPVRLEPPVFLRLAQSGGRARALPKSAGGGLLPYPFVSARGAPIPPRPLLPWYPSPAPPWRQRFQKQDLEKLISYSSALCQPFFHN